MPAVIVSPPSTATGTQKPQNPRYYNRPLFLISPDPSTLASPSEVFRVHSCAEDSTTWRPATAFATRENYPPTHETIHSNLSDNPTQSLGEPSALRATNRNDSSLFSIYTEAREITIPSSSLFSHNLPTLSGPSVASRASDTTYGPSMTREVSSHSYSNTSQQDPAWLSHSHDSVRLATTQSHILHPTTGSPSNHPYLYGQNSESYSNSHVSMIPSSGHARDGSEALQTLVNRCSAFADWAADYLFMHVCHAYGDSFANFHLPYYISYIRDDLSDRIHHIMKTIQMEPAAIFISFWYISKLPVGTYDSRHFGDEEPPEIEEIMLRAFVLGAILATKWLDDLIIPSRHWCHLSGLPVRLINSLERSAYMVLGYTIHMSCCEWYSWILDISYYHSAGPFFEASESHRMAHARIGEEIRYLYDTSSASKCTAAPTTRPDEPHQRIRTRPLPRNPRFASSLEQEAVNHRSPNLARPPPVVHNPNGPHPHGCSPLAPPSQEAAPVARALHVPGVIGEGVPGGTRLHGQPVNESRRPTGPPGLGLVGRAYLPRGLLSTASSSAVSWCPEADPVIQMPSRIHHGSL